MSSPPDVNVLPSVTIALRLYRADRFTGVPLEVAALTTSVTVVLCCNAPEVPVSVTVYVPAGVDPVVSKPTTDVPAPLTVEGLKLAVVPAGRPLALKAPLPLKPFRPPPVGGWLPPPP